MEILLLLLLLLLYLVVIVLVVILISDTIMCSFSSVILATLVLLGVYHQKDFSGEKIYLQNPVLTNKLWY